MEHFPLVKFYPNFIKPTKATCNSIDMVFQVTDNFFQVDCFIQLI